LCTWRTGQTPCCVVDNAPCIFSSYQPPVTMFLEKAT
jgi:hypothetical protein